jgi:hypothetical protein
MKFLGIFSNEASDSFEFTESLDCQISEQNLLFFCDQKPTVVDSDGLQKLVFGRVLEYDGIQKAALIEPAADGKFISIQISKSSEIEVSTDLNCRMDIYYVNTSKIKAFSNVYSVLEELLGEVSEIDQVSLAHSLSIYGNRPPKKRTFSTLISRLGYRESLFYRDNHLTIQTAKVNFGDFDYEKSEVAFLSQYASTFLEAIEKRASDSKNIVYFSSGWDSTAITAALVRLRGPKKVKCLIGEMRYSHRSGVSNRFELERARKICDYLGVELEVTPFDYVTEHPTEFDEIVKFIKSNQLPSMTAVNHFQLARAASKLAVEGAAIFAGEISDGAHNLGFAQFVSVFHPRSLEFREYSDKMRSYLFGPTFFESSSPDELHKDPIWKFISGYSNSNFDLPKSDIKARVHQFLVSFFLRNSRLPFTSRTDLRFLTPQGAQVYEEELSREYFDELENFFEGRHLYALYLHLYNSFHWQGSTVNSIEISGDYFGLEAFNPFHDRELIKLLQQMPEGYGRGLDFHPTKFPLKWTLEKVLNYDVSLNHGLHSYLYDEDPNFSHAEELLFHSALVPLFKSALLSSKLIGKLSVNLFDVNYIKNLQDSYVSGQRIDSKNYSDLLSLCMHSLIL